VAETDQRFAERVRQVREAKGLSQAHAAMKMAALHGYQWHQTVWSKIEAGERRVRLSEAVAMASALNVDLADLLEDRSSPDSRRAEISAALTEASRIEAMVSARVEQLRVELNAELSQMEGGGGGEPGDAS
jgi:transcriptional regulator with XRE-family HTH domain